MTPEQTDPHTRAAEAVHEGRPVEAQYVRGGRPGNRILVILVLSAGAAAILLLGMWFLSNGGFASQNANTGAQAVDARAFNQSEPASAPTANAPTTTGAAAPAPTGQTPNVNAPTQPSN